MSDDSQEQEIREEWKKLNDRKIIKEVDIETIKKFMENPNKDAF
eukprot:CAMPEP_0113647878 /NCGR_PEP_ID=MMETSP0017_2-20120614/25371_1 /TAXON_ID=2856 /ORGANISM="Cylindrotheca closterium" /LENGTH=43 /DNA_ID=CAMNT_0000560015 /DNA_START=168 /DNA_END=296 /DNA_ORIENTATION=- /assembly_acc=CAM_ASM_000147